MMLRVNDIFLDFNADIEIERKVKLFQNIGETDGDVSFSFNVELTSNNITALGLPFPDSATKGVYHTAPTDVLDENGLLVNRGSIRVERILGRFASCSFFGGNSNWFALLTGDMTELELSNYDKDITISNITDSWTEEQGIIFPLLDTGTFITRGYQVFLKEDFLGCMYLHTMIKETFKQSGLKIEGELIDDPFFKSIVVATNTRSILDVNNNSYFIARLADQVVPGSTASDPVIIDTYSTPYYLGADVVQVGNADFYASADMLVELDLKAVNTSGTNYLTPVFTINGLLPFDAETISASTSVSGTYTIKWRFKLDEGDYISFGIGNQFGSSQTLDLYTAKLTPLSIYKSFGGSSVPLWSKRDFVSNVLAMFNTIVKYDEYTKTVTINLFDKIKEKESIDISEFVHVDSVDYTEFISGFGKNNNFTYQEGSDEDLREYNISSFVKYGSGVIPANNDFLEESTDVIESEFTSPISYVNPILNASMERVPFVEFIEDNEQDITATVDDAGHARFEITDADQYYESGDLVRIKTTETTYNADFKVTSVTSTYIDVLLVDFVGDATGTATRLVHKLTTDDSVYLFSVTNNTVIRDFADTGFFIETEIIGIAEVASLAFFNLIRIGQPFESSYKQGLAFSRPNSPDAFQRTLIERYWNQFSRIVNDPVMTTLIGNLPWKVNNEIDFLRPISIKTIETSNLYYPNLISGYQNSYTPCTIELIKLP